MSGVDRIVNRILEDAQSQADSAREKAQREAESVLNLARQKAEEKRDLIIAEATREATVLQKRLIARAELESRKDILNTKQEVITKAFEKALEKLTSLPDEEYENMLLSLIIRSVEMGTEEIVLSPRDKSRITPDFLTKLNKEVANKGLKAELKLSSETAPIQGGFILRSGNIEVNNSFEAILKLMHNELAMEVARILFSA